MRTVNYKEKDYDQLFLSMMQDAYMYGLVSTDERFIEYIRNRQDIENMYCLFLSVYAFENSKIFEEMTKLYNSNDIDKAQGKDLDIIGNKFGIPRPSARKSSVELTFTKLINSDLDFIIPQGTIVSTVTGKNYYTVEDAVIIRGQSTTTVQAMSVENGYNSRVDRETLVVCSLSGISSVINYKGSSGGRGAYTDREYRQLIKNWAYSHIKGTKEAYDLFFAYYDGIDDYRLFPQWDGAGTLKIIVDPSDDWILNDISEKIFRNVQLIDDDVYVTGAIPRRIDVDCVINVDIDNAQYYSVDEREQIAELVEKAVRLYIDGGYRKDGRYYTGMGIGEDFVPFQLGLFISSEVGSAIRSVDFRDTIKNIDNTIYAHEFSIYSGLTDVCYDKTTKRLYSDDSREFVSPLLYITNATRLETDNEGFEIKFYRDDEEIKVDTTVAKKTNYRIYDLGGIDLYGCTIHLRAKNVEKASIGKLIIYGTDSKTSDNSYNSHIRISEEEIATVGNITVTVQNDYVNDSYTVCY
ncbi:MAG: baseplate J/gp47 family protein [Paludibacteraceae bacterium]|nr:baseplate J/gp47 family protein [Paludibacteraceae bacterium]